MARLLPNGGYGWAAMQPKTFSKSIKRAAKHIAAMYEKNEFDAVAFTGGSGAAIAFVLAANYSIPLLYVRKAGEKSHGKPVESNSREEIRKYLIVDDFVSTGSTVKSIVRKINSYCKSNYVKPIVPIGVYCFIKTWGETVKINKNLTIPIFYKETEEETV